MTSWEFYGVGTRAGFEWDGDFYYCAHNAVSVCAPGARTPHPEQPPLATISHSWRDGGVRREVDVLGGGRYWLLGTEVRDQAGGLLGTVQATRPSIFRTEKIVATADLRGVDMWLQIFLLLSAVMRQERSG